jgi:hypothetical protein
MYRSYLAGEREPRIGSEWHYVRGQGWLWDSTLGGRVPLVRYGTDNNLLPEGFQLDFEGAAFPRLQLQQDRQLEAVDFRFGMPLTMKSGPWEYKFAIGHVCAHLGDQYLLTHSGVSRINFSRDTLVLGVGFRPVPDVRLYAEAGWAFYTWGATEPWEFQFGFEFSPAQPSGWRGTPFLAINGHLRQEVKFGGALTLQTGWQWRGLTGHLFRIGLQYLDGKAEQYQFSDNYERQIGAGVWYDF